MPVTGKEAHDFVGPGPPGDDPAKTLCPLAGSQELVSRYNHATDSQRDWARLFTSL